MDHASFLDCDHARDELQTEMSYELLREDVNGKWDWGRAGRSQVRATENLRRLMSINPAFGVLIAHEYSDLVTLYGVN